MVLEVRRQALTGDERMQVVDSGLFIRIGAVMHHLCAAAFHKFSQADLRQQGWVMLLGNLLPGGFHDFRGDD